MPFVVTYVPSRYTERADPVEVKVKVEVSRDTHSSNCTHTHSYVIYGLGHAIRSAAMPVSRSRMQSFQENRLIDFQVRVGRKPVVWLMGRGLSRARATWIWKPITHHL